MKHQVCTMKELAEQYCRQLPRPEVQFNIFVNGVIIGFESLVVHQDGLNTTCESIYFEYHTEHAKDDRGEYSKSLLNEFIKEVSYQAEELAKKSLIQNMIMDLSQKL